MATKRSREGTVQPRKPSRPSTRKAAEPRAAMPEGERFVVLLRHGLAEDRTAEMADSERALTPEGHAQMKLIGRGLERALPKIQAIYSSPFLRATQTALWVSKAYRSRVAVTPVETLASGASAEDLVELISAMPERRVVIVGHEPSLTGAFRDLLRLQLTFSLGLDPGGCYGVRIGADGGAAVEWVLPPRILRKLGE